MKLWLLVLCLCALPRIALSQPSSLKGLTGVAVDVFGDTRVRGFDADLQDAIRRDAEVKLRVAGMEVLSSFDLLKKPRLNISMGIFGSRSSPSIFDLTVAFAEPAILERDPSIRVQAATWMREGVVFGSIKPR